MVETWHRKINRFIQTKHCHSTFQTPNLCASSAVYFLLNLLNATVILHCKTFLPGLRTSANQAEAPNRAPLPARAHSYWCIFFPFPFPPQKRNWHQASALFRAINSITALMLIFYNTAEQVQPGNNAALSWEVIVLAVFQFCYLN